MTDGWLGRAARLLTYALQLGLVAILAYALVTGNSRLVTNTIPTLAVAAFPLYVRFRYDRALHPVLALWIVVAAFLHAAGIMGPYREFGWYDQIAHGVSGALVAGVGYALVTTIEAEYDDVRIPENLRFLFIVVFTVSFGVLWEVAEFALGKLAGGTGKAALIQFGLADVVWDLVLDLAGALLVAFWASGYFDGLRAIIDRHVEGTDGDVDREGDAEQPQ